MTTAITARSGASATSSRMAIGHSTIALVPSRHQRRGDAGVWWKGLPSYKDDADEAYSILNSLKLGGVAYRDTRELAYGQQRLLEIALALATKPKVLLLEVLRMPEGRVEDP